jgi:serine/threonine protein phosphatase 1
MFAKILSSMGRSRATVAHAPEGRRLYAIGDIHGHLNMLEGLLEQIHADDRSRGRSKGEIIFLGDLINRGPQSAQVIDYLIKLKTERPETRFLLGNHEEVFLKALDGSREALRLFDRIGGAETILSYGISPQTYEAADYGELSKMLQSAVPNSHKHFLQSFEDMIVEGDYVFVHAGVRPSIPLDKQKKGDLRWIREDFLRETERNAPPAIAGMVVVHGHTISENIVEGPGRIGLDTGAYRSGVLSAMAFEGDKRWIIQQYSELSYK